jgi:exodeoxyribonuclease V alpha subunit
MTLDDTQLKAVQMATSGQRLTLISGGAGTGKTTIIKSVCDVLDERREPYNLCAFAGKAAARLREATGRKASTIHRMLQYNGTAYKMPDGGLSGYTIIADEASMLDSHLLAEVVRRRPARLVLVGDQAQLPPVGKGQPYHDLLALCPALTVNLTRCYRNKEAVFQAAMSIRSGDMPPMQLTSEDEKWTVLNTGDSKQTQERILAWVASSSWDWATDIVLCPRNGETEEDAATVIGLNRAIADEYRPRDWNNRAQKWQVGDRVINTKNMPNLDVWNGTTGTVSSVDIDGGVWVTTDEPVQADPGSLDTEMTNHVLFGKESKKHLQLAYALTCHKAQGSQARRVIVVCLDKDTHTLLTRSWVYTAVTRARTAAVVCGQVSALRAGIAKVEAKHTVLQEIGASEEN